MAKKKSFWKSEALWAVIVGSLIVWGIVEILTTGWLFPTLWGWIKAAAGFFSSPLTLPVWVVALLLLVGGAAIVGLIALVRHRSKEVEDGFHAKNVPINQIEGRMTTTQLLSLNVKIRDLVVEANDLEGFLTSIDEMADSFPQDMVALFRAGFSSGSAHEATKAVYDKYRASVPENLPAIFRNVHRLKEGLNGLRSESSSYLSYTLHSTRTLLEEFEASLNNFAAISKPESMVILAFVSRELHAALRTLRDASISLIAVLNQESPQK